MGESRKSARRQAREYAMQAIYQWQISKESADEIVLQFEAEHNFAKVDKQYWRELVKEISANIEKIDEAMHPFLTRKPSAINAVELAILSLSIYELTSRPDIPYKVVINEALELTKTFGAQESYRFINGVLDAAAKVAR